MKEEFLSIQKAAEWLGVSPTTLRRWEERSVLVPERTHGNQRRYALSQLQAFKTGIQNRTIQPQENTPTNPSIDATNNNQEILSPIAQAPLQDYLSLSSATSPANDAPINVSTEEHTIDTTAEQIAFMKQLQGKKNRSFFKPNIGTITAGLVLACLLIVVMFMPVLHLPMQNAFKQPQKGDVLAMNRKGNNLVGDVLFNAPAIFEAKVTVNKDFVVNGKSLFNEDIKVNNKNVDLGTGKLTASNVVYGLTAGANITISGDPQNPTISAADNTFTGVESFQGETGVIALTEGDGIGLDGLTITNTGVLSLGGEVGDVELTAGDGIGVDGLTITNDDPGSAQNIFKNIIVDAETIIADSNDDTLTFEAGSGIVLTPDPLTKKITITSNASGTLAGLTTNGVMYATNSTNASSTAPGTNGTVLKGVTGGAPVFGAVSLSTDVTDALGVGNGGTGVTTTPTNGQLLIGNGSGYTLGTITAGSGIGIGNGSGTVTVTNNGVLSLAGTANQVSVSGATGSITVSLPQNIHTAASPTFASMTFTNNTNQLVLGSGNTGTITMAALTSGQTYTLPNASGEICLSSGNCPSMGGGTIDGSGTTNYLAKFTNTNDIGNSLIYDTGQKIGIGTISPQGLFSVSGGAAGTALVSLDETGDQNILVGSASGTTRFVFDRSGNLNLVGGGYQINGNTVISATALGSNVVTSSLTSVGTLGSGSIASGFGSIDTGTDAISGGDITATGGTGFISSGNDADLTFSGTGNHLISASAGTLQLGTVTLNGAVTGNNQSITGLNSLAASGTITFGAFTSNGGILYTNGSGQLTQVTAGSSTQVLKGGTTPSFGSVALGADVSGTLPVTNGGTGLNTVTTGDLIYASGSDTLGRRAIGSPGQILTVQGGIPVWADPGGATNYWQRGDGTVAPNIITDDLLLGSAATASAKFAFTNVSNGTPTASISAGIGSNATYLTGTGSLGTTNGQTLTLGSASTGNIVLDSGSGLITLADATVLSSNLTVGGITLLNGSFTLGDNGDLGSINTSDWDISTTGDLTGITNISNDGSYTQTGSSQNTFSGNVDATSGLDVTGASLTIGGTNATITTAGVITGTTINATSGLQTSNTTRIDASGNITNIAGISSSLTPTAANTYALGTAVGNQYSTIYGQTLYQNGNQVCDTGGNCSGLTTTYWNQADGTVAPKNSTVDFLVGGIATNSAKFAVVNVNSGVPTASVSAGVTGAAYITANGTLTTTNAQTLTLGGATSGTIVLDSGSGVISLLDALTLNGNFTQTGSGTFSTGTGVIALNGDTTIQSDNTFTLAALTTNGGLLYTNGAGTVAQTAAGSAGQILRSNGTGAPTWVDAASVGTNHWQSNNGTVTPINVSDDLLLGGTATTSAKFAFINNSGAGTPTASISGSIANNALYVTGDGTLATTNKQTLTLGSASTGNIVLNGFGAGFVRTNASGVLSSGAITLGTDTDGNYVQSVSGGSGIGVSGSAGEGWAPALALGNLSADWDQTGAFDIVLNNASSELRIREASGSFFGTIDVADLDADKTYNLPTFTGSSADICLSTGNCSGLTATYWNQADGALSPKNTSVDLLVGGTATSSAKFAVLNINTGTPTASIAGSIANSALYLTGDGTLATANRQTLTLGSSSTGNVVANGSAFLVSGLTNCDTIDTDANGRFVCGSDAGGAGGAGTINVQNNGSPVGTIDTMNFSSLFTVTTSPATTAHVTLATDGLNFTELADAMTLDAATTVALSTFDLTLGTNTGIGGVVVAPNAGGNAALIVNKQGNNDIFTASAAGATKFTIANNGNISASGSITGLTGVTSSGSIQFTGFTNNGGLLYTNGSGVLAQTAAGTGTQCLIGGATPTWGNCDSASASYWQMANGTILTGNSTVDMLIGGTATTSAKFAFTNVNSGTPTASISANTANNNTFLTGAGNLGTTNAQTLTLGGTSTGNIMLDSGSGLITLADATVLSSNLTVGGVTLLNGSFTLGDNGDTGAINTSDWDIATNGDMTGIGAISLDGNFTQSGSTTLTTGTGQVTLAGNVDATNGLDVTGASLTVNGNATITTAGAISGTQLDVDGTLRLDGTTLSTVGAGNDLTLSAAGNNILIADNNTLNAGGGAAAAYNFFANNGETPEQAGIDADNDLYIGGSLEVDGTIYQGDNQVCDTSGNCSGLTVTYWNQTNGALAPKNSTVDFLVGGTATSSAKFAVINVNAGTPTASLSGATGGTYLAATGNLQTTNNQTLTIGGSTTGNIAIDSGNGLISLLDATTIAGAFTQTGGGQVSFGGNVDVTNGLDVTGASLTVNGTAAITTAGAISGTQLDIDGTLRLDGTTLSTVGGGNDLTLSAAGGDIVSSNRLTLGTVTPGLGQLNVIGAQTGTALVILDETGNQNILVGSASGTTRFAFDRTGNLNLSGGGYQIAGQTVIDTARNLANIGTIDSTYLDATTNNVNLAASTTFSMNGNTILDASRNLQNIAGVTTDLIPTANNTYDLGSSTNRFAEIHGQALYQNGNQVCDTGGNCSGLTVTYWNQANGALAPKNSTVDFLVGGTATNSAKFAVINVNSGTPTASLSGATGGAYLTAAGALQTTALQTLTLGGTTTGNITLDSGSGSISLLDATTIAGALNQTGAGQVTFSGNVDATNGLDVTGASLTVNGTAAITTAGAISGTQLDIDGTLRLDGTTLSTQGGGNDLTLSAAGGDIVSSNRLTIGTTSPGLGQFNVLGAQTGKALTILDETGDQNILVGSASGTTRFAFDRTGNLNLSGGGYQIGGQTVIDASRNITNAGTLDTTYIDASANNVNLAASTTFSMNGSTVLDASRNLQNIAGVTTDLIPTANNTYDLGSNANRFAEIHGQALYQGGNQVCDTGGNCSGLTVTYWNQANGAISAKNSTVDLLVGGVSTASAKFAITNVAGNAPVASLSGSTGGTYLTANGSLQTTNNQTLTIGGSTTGTIVLNSGNGNISLLDNLSVNGNGLITTAGAITGTQLDIDGTLRLDGTTLSTVGAGNDLTLDATGDNIVFANNDTLIIGGHTGNVAYNVISDSGGSPTSGQVTTDNDLYVQGAVEAGALYQGSNQVCDTSGNCSGLTVTYWNQTNGAIAAKNATVDLLLGGVSTGSAKFAVTGMNSGTPTASISANSGANATYLTGTGVLGTTNKQTLTLGSTSTGNVSLAPNGSDVLTAFVNGNVGIGIGSADTKLDVNGNISARGTTLTLSDSTTYAIRSLQSTGVVTIGGDLNYGYIQSWGSVPLQLNNQGNNVLLNVNGGSVGIGTTGPDRKLDILDASNPQLRLTQADGSVYADFQVDTNGDLKLNVDGVSNQLVLDNGGSVGVGTTTPTALLDVAGTASVSSTLTFRTGTGMIQTTANNALTLGGNTTGMITLMPNNGGGVINLDVAATNGLQINGTNGATISSASCVTTQNGIVTGSALCEMGLDTWTGYPTNGVVATSNSTMDVLVGGIATSSARFAITGIAPGTPVASLSASTNNSGLSFNAANAAIQSTRNNTLTLGGDTTGDILLNDNTFLGSATTGLNITTAGVINDLDGSVSINDALSVSGNVTLGNGQGGTSGIGLSLPSNASDFNSIFGEHTGVDSKLVLRNGDDELGDYIALRSYYWLIGEKDQVLSNFNGVRIWDAINAGLLNGDSGIASVSYNRFGTGTTDHGLATSSALLVSGLLEVNGTSYFDGGATIASGQNLTLASAGFTNCSLLTTSSNVVSCGTLPTNHWNIANGLLYNGNLTTDFAIGGATSASAKFKVSMSGTQPTASIAGTTAAPALLVDNRGSGDIFTGSSGGIMRFVIKQNGNVGIDNGNPQHKLQVDSGNILVKGTNNFAVLGDRASVYIGDTNNSVSAIANTGITLSAFFAPDAFTLQNLTGNVGIGTTSPTAKLDIRGNVATDPVASISGSTTNAGLIVDNRGSGSILTASSAGLTRFVIAQNGNVGIGTGTPDAPLNLIGYAHVVNGSGSPAGFIFENTIGSAFSAYAGSSNPALQYDSNFDFAIKSNTRANVLANTGSGGTDRLLITGTGRIGINNSFPTETLDVIGLSGTLAVASFSGQTHRAAVVVDNNGTGDIFTASKSGATKFTVLNSGNIRMANYNTAGGVFYANSSGDLLLSAQGSSGQCLQSNGAGAPTWGSCDQAASVNAFTLANGLIYNGNLTTDFAIGGATSASAKFKVSLSGTQPTASISGLTSGPALLVDNRGSGDLFAASSGGIARFAIKQNGNVGIGTSANAANFTLDVGGTAAINYLTDSARYGINTGGGMTMTRWNSANPYFYFNLLEANSGYIWYNNNGANEMMRLNTFGGLGLGTSNPLARLDVRGNFATSPVASFSAATTHASLVVDNSGSGDLFTASSSGRNRFVIKQNGNVGIGTTNPNYTLSLGGTRPIHLDSAGGNIYMQGDSGAWSNGLYAQGSAGTDRGGLGFYGNADTLQYYYFGTGSGYNNPLLNILPNGKVGIGIPNANLNDPLATLDIRTKTAHQPVASVSGSTSFASLVVNNSGSGDLFTASSGGNTRFTIKQNGNVVLGSNTIAGAIQTLNGNTLNLGTGATGNINLGTDAVARIIAAGNTTAGTALQFTSGVTTGNTTSSAFAFNANSVTSGTGLYLASSTITSGTLANISSTSNAMTSGGLIAADWSPTAPATTSGDLVSINLGANADVTGNIFDVEDNDSSLFSIDESVITNYLPTQFTAAGDVSIAYDLVFTNQSSTYIKSNAPLYLEAGESFESNDLTLRTFNSGYINFETNGSTSMQIDNSGNVAIGTTSAQARLAIEGGNVMIGQKPNTAPSSAMSWNRITQSTAGTIASGDTSGIASISASVVYNGSLYVGTSKTRSAEVYRYNGTSGSWTKVSQSTAGTIRSGGTSAIDGVTSMAVYNGHLYIGTQKWSGSGGEVYRYDGGTTWTVLSAAAGQLASGGTSGIIGVTAMQVHNSALYVGTRKWGGAEIYTYGEGSSVFEKFSSTAGQVCREGKFDWVTGNADSATITEDWVTAMAVNQGILYAATAKHTNNALLCRHVGGTGNQNTWEQINGQNTGSFTPGSFYEELSGAAISSVTAITSMVSYQGSLYLGLKKSNGAEVLRYNLSNYPLTQDDFTRMNNAAGTIQSGGTANIDAAYVGIYNGQLYVGTEESNSAQIYRYGGGAGSTSNWVRVSQTTAGTIANGGTASIDQISNFIQYGDSFFAATYDTSAGSAELYQNTNVSNQSYALQFHAGLVDRAGGEQSGLMNIGSISFIASPSGGTFNTGAFLFSHQIITNNGAYDVAEDYPTRDESLEPGDILAVDENEEGMVKKASGQNDSVIGIYSENPGFRLSQADLTINGGRAVPVAMVGRVPVKVTTANGPIKAGDILMPSSIPGVAVKGTQAGFGIGRALASYNASDPSAIGKVMVYVNPTWYDPGVALGTDGNITLYGKPLSTESLDEALALVKEHADVKIQELTNNVTTISQKTETLTERVASIEAKLALREAVIINADADGLIFEDKIASSAAIAGLKETDASQSGQINTLASQLTSLNDRLAFIENNASASSLFGFTASSAAELGLDALDASNATISHNLNVLGRAVFSDVGITGTLTTGVLSIRGLDDDGTASITTSVGPLKLQANGFNGIEMLGGKVTIDTKGNFITTGAITTKKVNIDTTDVAGASLGEATLKASTTKVTVTTSALTTKSKIFVQPIDVPVTTAVKKIDADTFEIRIETAKTTDIKLNWWIVN